jgi:uncharacterized membrane protein
MDTLPTQPPSSPPPATASDSGGTAKIIYILYLVGLVVGVTTIVGVIMAYVNQGQAPDWLKTHYRFQIRTFWIGVLYGFVSLLLSFVLIGFLTGLFTLVWLIVRCVKGLQGLEKQQPCSNPATWLW